MNAQVSGQCLCTIANNNKEFMCINHSTGSFHIAQLQQLLWMAILLGSITTQCKLLPSTFKTLHLSSYRIPIIGCA